MRSKTAILNAALVKLGGHELGRENSTDNPSAASTLFRACYPHIVGNALARAEWSFARKVVSLGKKNPTGLEPKEYPLRYALPRDCIRPMRLLDDSNYIVEGQDILTATNPANFVYIAYIDDPAFWTPTFYEAVVWGVASELSTAINNDPRQQQAYGVEAEKALDRAIAIESNSQLPSCKTSPWLSSRG